MPEIKEPTFALSSPVIAVGQSLLASLGDFATVAAYANEPLGLQVPEDPADQLRTEVQRLRMRGQIRRGIQGKCAQDELFRGGKPPGPQGADRCLQAVKSEIPDPKGFRMKSGKLPRPRRQRPATGIGQRRADAHAMLPSLTRNPAWCDPWPCT